MGELTEASVSVVYCVVDRQYCIDVPWVQGMTAVQALQLSQLATQVTLPEPLNMGIFSVRLKQPEQYLMQVGDRLEIYRPLTLNPKETRRKRALRHPVGRVLKRGNHWHKQQKNHTD